MIAVWESDISDTFLRANVSKDQKISNICGKGQKIDVAHTFKFDTLSC